MFLKEGDDLSKEDRLVGELIYNYRKRLRYTLQHLSELSGIPKGTISRIERGETKHPELTTVLALTSSLSIPYLDVLSHYIVTERRKNVLQQLLVEAVQKGDSKVIENIAVRFLECDSEDSYDLVEELYRMTESLTDNTIKLRLFKLITKYAREHGILPYVAKALFQKYLIERNDLSKLESTYHKGMYILHYINFFSDEDKGIVHLKLGYHAYVLQLYEKCIQLCNIVVKELTCDRLMKARARLLICNSYYYLGEYFLAEQHLVECKKYPFDEIQENVKLNEAAILGRKGDTEQAIAQLRICLDQSPPNNAIHIINELLVLYLQIKDINSMEILLKDETRILNAKFDTPFKKSELALYFKLKAEYYILIRNYGEAVNCFIESAIRYTGVSAYKDSNECFYLLFKMIETKKVNIKVNKQLIDAYNKLRQL